MTTEKVAEKLKTLPTRPGVYQYFDANGKIIYVGKAINLRNRVRSYFHASADHGPKTERLVAEIADLEWIITDSELEALLLLGFMGAIIVLTMRNLANSVDRWRQLAAPMFAGVALGLILITVMDVFRASVTAMP